MRFSLNVNFHWKIIYLLSLKISSRKKNISSLKLTFLVFYSIFISVVCLYIEDFVFIIPTHIAFPFKVTTKKKERDFPNTTLNWNDYNIFFFFWSFKIKTKNKEKGISRVLFINGKSVKKLNKNKRDIRVKKHHIYVFHPIYILLNLI